MRPPGTRARGRAAQDSTGRRIGTVHGQGSRRRAHDDVLVHSDDLQVRTPEFVWLDKWQDGAGVRERSGARPQ
jgi:hypothetical protein